MAGKRNPILAKATAVIAVSYVFVRFVISPPLPFSLILMYMSLVVVGVLVYVSIYEDDWQDFSSPIEEFFRGSAQRGVLWQGARTVALVLIPLFVGYMVYNNVKPSFNPPAEQRVVHPAPPFEVTGLTNPLRSQTDRAEEISEIGARVYFENCVFCHGDRFDGKGHFAHGFNLPPADFVNSGTIDQLQESFVFWRVSTGGPGLPDGSTPWNSAMPRWEERLTEEERWAVIMFLYEQTGWEPRTWE